MIAAATCWALPVRMRRAWTASQSAAARPRHQPAGPCEGRAASALAIGAGLLARLALVVRGLEPSDLTPATLLRAGAGVFLLCAGLLCAGAAFVVGTGGHAIGMGTLPPNASLCRLLGDTTELVLQRGAGTVLWVAWVSILTAGPCLLAAWALLRPFNRGQAWGRLFG